MFLIPGMDKEPMSCEPFHGIIYIGDSNHWQVTGPMSRSWMAMACTSKCVPPLPPFHSPKRQILPLHDRPRLLDLILMTTSESPDKILSMIGLRVETSRAGRPTNRKRWQIPAIHGATHHKASTSTEYSIRTGKTPGRLTVLYRHDAYILVNPVGLGGPQYRKYPASLLGYKWTVGRALELQWTRLAL